jgi:hypothetical protein
MEIAASVPASSIIGPESQVAMWTQAIAVHESVVHGSPSSQSESIVQQPAIGLCPQPAGSAHMSAVQALPSSQLSGVAAGQLPPAQTSAPLHVTPSEHEVPSVFVSAGHAGSDATHVSAGSHVAFVPAARHTVPAATRLSVQPPVTPSHESATSHAPIDARHIVPAGATTSAGHAAVAPSQLSAVSQTLAAARHTWVLASGEHVPSIAAPAATEQAWQSPVPPAHATLQQTPSTQNPVAQVAPVVHESPFELRRSSTYAEPALVPPAVVSLLAPTSTESATTATLVPNRSPVKPSAATT